ncbi:hypothetical protein GCM10010334_75080 [Streptomyces finlayi]|uniref:Uncharacterized protein n=2 Tax=Streptomyces finlayi TaxID=67296 RepID=A0A919CEJ1_9ACTN|nr:hypothetical protein GCM10010334_75080 [Streptomyces finlayi]
MGVLWEGRYFARRTDRVPLGIKGSPRKLRRFLRNFRAGFAWRRRMDDHQFMNTDLWVVLADSERRRWEYFPRQSIGPLRFGMERQEAITAMGEHGFTATQEDLGLWCDGKRAQWRLEFRRAASHYLDRAVAKCYFVEGVGLSCVLVDGLCGPQVTHEGIRLVGRVPSELNQEMEAYALETGEGFRINGEGDVYCDSFVMERGTQRAGDSVVTWALFYDLRGIAGTSWDMAPTEVWHHS